MDVVDHEPQSCVCGPRLPLGEGVDLEHNAPGICDEVLGAAMPLSSEHEAQRPVEGRCPIEVRGAEDHQLQARGMGVHSAVYSLALTLGQRPDWLATLLDDGRGDPYLRACESSRLTAVRRASSTTRPFTLSRMRSRATAMACSRRPTPLGYIADAQRRSRGR